MVGATKFSLGSIPMDCAEPVIDFSSKIGCPVAPGKVIRSTSGLCSLMKSGCHDKPPRLGRHDPQTPRSAGAYASEPARTSPELAPANVEARLDSADSTRVWPL